MATQPAAALQSLLTEPKHFLQRFPIRVAGVNRPSGIYTYSFDNRNYGASERPGSFLGTLRMHGTEGFSIDPFVPGKGESMRAFSIGMAQSNVAPIAFYTLPLHGGPDIMVTGALSGCSFIVNPGQAAGSIDCAHLQPNGETGAALNTRLAANQTAVYGRHNYAHTNDPQNALSFDRTATVIGVRRHGVWKVYAQKLDTLNAMSVRSVHRIYP